ncbi:MAG: WYL domain-containing protein [Actinomycetota bacterium]|nr:WYL domain-containing protein [Actinomycetota bacterium]
MDKLERLLNLTAALLHAEIPLTAEELRDRVGGYPDTKATFRRAFERDKDDLRSMGMPLRVEPVPGVDPPVDGYRLDRDEYAGTELAFEADELAALHLATSIVRLDGDDTALVKLGAAGGNAPTDSVGRVPFNDTLATMIGAAVDRKALAFTYNDVERIVEPWKLSFTRGHWYLSGFDRLRQDQRLYRVDRIEGDVSLSGPAEAPVGDVNEPIDLRGWELGDGPAVEATIVVDADQAAYARHILGDVVDQPDGSVTATLDVRNIDAFRSFVLSFLEHAEILEPADLRSDFVEWLEAQQ